MEGEERCSSHFRNGIMYSIEDCKVYVDGVCLVEELFFGDAFGDGDGDAFGDGGVFFFAFVQVNGLGIAVLEDEGGRWRYGWGLVGVYGGCGFGGVQGSRDYVI